jgi:hypothetical protein
MPIRSCLDRGEHEGVDPQVASKTEIAEFCPPLTKFQGFLAGQKLADFSAALYFQEAQQDLSDAI